MILVRGNANELRPRECNGHLPQAWLFCSCLLVHSHIPYLWDHMNIPWISPLTQMQRITGSCRIAWVKSNQGHTMFARESYGYFLDDFSFNITLSYLANIASDCGRLGDSPRVSGEQTCSSFGPSPFVGDKSLPRRLSPIWFWGYVLKSSDLGPRVGAVVCGFDLSGSSVLIRAITPNS